MKKEVIFIVLLLIIPVVYSLSPGTTKGYVLNTSGNVVTGASVSIVVNGCSGGDCTATDVTDANGFYIESNLNIVPGNTVTVTATKGLATGSNTETATGSGDVGVAIVNVTISIPPGSPSLTPVLDTHDNSLITMSWTSGTGATYDEFQFDSGSIVSPATSPQTKTNVAYTIHTWRVRSCDSYSCSAYVTDSFYVNNSASSLPSLIDQGHTTSLTPSLMWTNYSDPDGDPTHNEFQLSTDPGFSTIVQSDMNAVSPKTTIALTTFTMYYWRVRTCDDIGACSAYSTDSFFVYSCPAGGNGTTVTVTRTRTRYRNVTEMCIPDWECGDWGNCAYGVSTRTCNDKELCVEDLPKEYQLCQAAVTEQPKPVEFGRYFIGDFNYNDYYTSQIGTQQSWRFIYEDEEHYFRILDIQDKGILFEITSKVQQGFILYNETKEIDLDDDNINDISVRVIQKNDKTLNIAFTRLKKAETRIPSFVSKIKEELAKGNIFTYLLLLITIILAIIVLYQQKKYVRREIKIDKKLIEYVKKAMERGFTETQIRDKLSTNGFADVEIDYVLKRIK